MVDLLPPPPPWNPGVDKKKSGGKNMGRFRQVYDLIIASPIIMTVVVFVAATMLVVGITLHLGYYSDSFREEVMAEAHGVLMDILLIGVVLFWFQQKGKNLMEKRHYRDEIDDFRNWESEEAARKTRGNIRRLNKYGVTRMDLSNCYLRSMDLRGVDLSESYLWGADLSWTDLRDSIFEEANLENVNLEAANLTAANLYRAYLWKTNLESVDLQQACLERAILRESRLAKADLAGANLMYADLAGAVLEDANLMGADLRHADLTRACLDGADLRGVNFDQAAGLSVDSFVRIRTLQGAILDADLEAELRRRLPDVFLPPDATEDW
ncbi:pentapeptide repeat-containing protein [Desulfobotulus sp. H1]|uniref:Pentapeptide repeat-containing protein n=1 Tax=Desulfobotulus pelophilus TaxID=2823377 RepID=A0ABT3NCB0_9BACT|nr:pentapeptide repeat-containing protein [Desulfobotulus pelophilus]MCW7754816.1 pentapeptide repeat-containing protein [Desulfobotulus pelophilus]